MCFFIKLRPHLDWRSNSNWQCSYDLTDVLIQWLGSSKQYDLHFATCMPRFATSEHFVWTSLRLNAEPRMTLKSLNLTISTASTTASAAVNLGISLKAIKKIYKSVLTSKHQSILATRKTLVRVLKNNSSLISSLTTFY